MGRIVRVITADAAIVCSAIEGTDIAARIEQIHGTSAVCTAALGRLALGASLMGFGLKNEQDTLTLRLDGGGAAGSSGDGGADLPIDGAEIAEDYGNGV